MGASDYLVWSLLDALSVFTCSNFFTAFLLRVAVIDGDQVGNPFFNVDAFVWFFALCKPGNFVAGIAAEV